jgi:hypothetical protein
LIDDDPSILRRPAFSSAVKAKLWKSWRLVLVQDLDLQQRFARLTDKEKEI